MSRFVNRRERERERKLGWLSVTLLKRSAVRVVEMIHRYQPACYVCRSNISSDCKYFYELHRSKSGKL